MPAYQGPTNSSCSPQAEKKTLPSLPTHVETSSKQMIIKDQNFFILGNKYPTHPMLPVIEEEKKSHIMHGQHDNQSITDTPTHLQSLLPTPPIRCLQATFGENPNSTDDQPYSKMPPLIRPLACLLPVIRPIVTVKKKIQETLMRIGRTIPLPPRYAALAAHWENLGTNEPSATTTHRIASLTV